ncbi:MAG: protein kinase [Deltaproteobacteria bacterium]|nr:protein kinase [Deltaproteobacteria bacterium]
MRETFGPYEIVRRLGHGGMAETFLAVRRGPGDFEQRVCLKRVLPDFCGDHAFESMFLDEARIGASLRHSGIVGVIDFGDVDGRLYMALELVDGVDLCSILRVCPGHRLGARVVGVIASDLLHALDYAHARTRAGQPDGVVHRDLSPSNVLVSYAGEVKLTDFGIARAMGTSGATATSSVKGKIPYLSPEQARAEVVDGRSDLFSLGVVLFEALSGARPFDGATMSETMGRLLSDVRRPIAHVAPETPVPLAAVVERLLAHAPSDRFATATEALEALAAAGLHAVARRDVGALASRVRPKQTVPGQLDGAAELTGAPPGQPAQQIERASLRDRLLTAGGIFLLCLTAFLAYVAIAYPPDRSPTPPIAAPPVLFPAPGPVALPAPLAPAIAPVEAPPPGASDAGSPPPGADASARRPVGERARRSVLQATVVPWGRLWIDGRPLERGSARLELAPGRHVVGAGHARPTVTQVVELAPGERRSIVLRLR